MKLDACFMKGWRTLTACGAFLLTGLLSVAGELDLTPLVELFVKNPQYLGIAMLGVGALFAALRYLSSTPLGERDTDGDYSSLAGVENRRASRHRNVDEGT